MWLTKLKIAIVEKNIDQLDKLMDDLPQLKNKKELEEAVYLIREASELVYTLKDETSSSLKQIKKNLNFLKSTEVKASPTLDIKL